MMSLIIWGAIVLGAVGLDQLTKALIVENLMLGERADLLPPIVGFYRITPNTGAAFGMLSGNRILLLVISSLAMIAIGWCLFHHRHDIPRSTGIGIAMILGGGIGNQIDRFVNGGVVDFLELLFMDFAVFNVADCFVTIGVAFVIIDALFFHRDFMKKVLGDDKNNRHPDNQRRSDDKENPS